MGLGLVTPPETEQLSLDLSEAEQTELALCEAVIERGRQMFLEVGGALMTIQEKRLYRATHTTFDAYCREKWQIGKSYAYDMIAAYGIVENVRHSGQTDVLPENPKQALALRQVPKEEQGTVLKKAVGTAPEGGVTAAHIEETANRHLGKPESVDAVTMAALCRAFSPDLHKGHVEPPVLVNGRLYVTQTKRAEAYGEEIERGQALCFQAVEMDWWIGQQNPVVRPEQWEQEFQSGKRKSADDVRGLRVVATGVKAPATCYYVLTGEKVTFVHRGGTEKVAPRVEPTPPHVLRGPMIEFVVLEPEADMPKSEPKIDTSEEYADTADTSVTPEPEPSEDTEDTLPTFAEPAAKIVLRGALEPRVKNELKSLGEKMTAACGKSGIELSQAELKRLYQEIQRLQTIEHAYSAVKTNQVEGIRLQLQAWQDNAASWKEQAEDWQRQASEAQEQLDTFLNAPTPAGPKEGVLCVAGRDYRLLVALSERKRPGQTETPTPAEYLQVLIQQRADMAGIELPDELPRCQICKTELSPTQTETPVLEDWKEHDGTSLFLHDGNILLAGKYWYCADCAPQFLSQGNHLSQAVLKRRFA